MKVKELIGLLQKVDQRQEVAVKKRDFLSGIHTQPLSIGAITVDECGRLTIEVDVK